MAEFIITAVNIFVLAFAVGYFGSGMIGNLFNKRKAGIVESIDSARKQKEDAAKLHMDYEKKVSGFMEEKAAILERAGEKAKLREAEIMDDAHAEAERIILRARKEAELKKLKLKDDIKRDMVTYATAAAAKIIAENMTDDIQAQLIENTLNGMGETTWQN